LAVGIVAGNIIEENHYYPYGLKIAGISSDKFGDVEEGKLNNPYQYNDKEMLDENAGLNCYDYGFRNYDPEIGRFPQLDPLTDSYPELTPYQYASCEPIANVDMDGLEGFNVLPTITVTAARFTQQVVSSTAPILAGVGGALFGIGNSLWNAGKGLVNSVTHLPTTLINLQKLTTPQGQLFAGLSIYISFNKKVQDYKKGNIFTRASIISGAITDLATLVGTDGVGEGAEAIKLSEITGEVGETAVTFEDIVKVGKSTENGTNVVYQGFDRVTGELKYIGITERDPLVRFNEHLNSETERALLRYETVPGATNLSRIEARIWEQNLINQHGLEDLMNIRNSIAPKYWLKYDIKY